MYYLILLSIREHIVYYNMLINEYTILIKLRNVLT